jgi:CheY-like chemotaxis protein/rubrerythrin
MSGVPRVLVIDDEPIVLKSCDRILRREGVQIEGALTGTDGLRRVTEGGFDVLLLDLRMPGATGIDVLRGLREAKLEPTVIIMTGYPSIGSAVEAMKLGAFDYIVKPFEPIQLAQAVRRALAMRETLDTAPVPQELEPSTWRSAGQGRSINTTTRDGRRVSIVGLDGLFEPRAELCSTIVESLKAHHAPANIEYGTHEAAGQEILTYLENFDTVVAVVRIPLKPEDGQVVQLATGEPSESERGPVYDAPQIGFPNVLHWTHAIGIHSDLVVIAVDRQTTDEAFPLGQDVQREIVNLILREMSSDTDRREDEAHKAHGHQAGPCQTLDVLQRVREFHETMSGVYASMRDKVRNEKVRLLFDHMSGREHGLAHDLAEYEKVAPKAILKTWYKPAPRCMAPEWLKNLDISPDASLDEALDLIIRVDDCLARFYKYMAELTVCEEVKEAFTNLLEIEQREKIHVMCLLADS